MIDAVIPGERWVPVVGYQDYYEVSDLGRVRGVDRVVPNPRTGSQRVRGRILKQGRHPKGYPQVHLQANGIDRSQPVHRIVTAAFLGPCPPGQEVRHGPSGQLDNRLTNLSYGTRRENHQDQRRDGTKPQSNRGVCPRRHPLEEPNLVLGHLRRGWRSCLACSRAHATASRARRAGIVLDVQAESDRRYALIVAGEAARLLEGVPAPQ